MPTLDKKNVLVVIPALNEEHSIEDVIISSRNYGEVLVIDDGSTDKTAQFAEKAGAKLILNSSNKGYEFSLNEGYKYAQSKNFCAMITIDADGQLPAERIPDFLLALDKGMNIVVGSRKKLVRLSERLLGFFSKKTCLIQDPFCGMKAYDLTVYRQSVFSDYNSVGTALALKYVSLGFSVENIEITVVDRLGQSRFGGRLMSELRLLPSLTIGSIQLLKMIIFKKK